MRIIDKNTDFYDFWQNIYRDSSVTFDRTDSYLLTKDIMCRHLGNSIVRSRHILNKRARHIFALLQICNTLWLFLVEITEKTDYDSPKDYTVELITTWKDYSRKRFLIRLDIVDFGLGVDALLHRDGESGAYDKSKIMSRVDTIIQAVNSNDYRIVDSIDKEVIYRGDHTKVEKHIPLLKACGIANCIDSLGVFLAFEEFFSLEKSSSERTASVGLTNDEKIGNHGFDLKTSFRGKTI